MKPDEDSLEVMLVYSDYLLDKNQQSESDFIKDLLSFPNSNQWCYQWRNVNTGVGSFDEIINSVGGSVGGSVDVGGSVGVGGHSVGVGGNYHAT